MTEVICGNAEIEGWCEVSKSCRHGAPHKSIHSCNVRQPDCPYPTVLCEKVKLKAVKLPDSTIETLPTCPFCKYVEDDYYDLKDGDEWECSGCGKKSTITIHSSFSLEPKGD